MTLDWVAAVASHSQGGAVVGLLQKAKEKALEFAEAASGPIRASRRCASSSPAQRSAAAAGKGGLHAFGGRVDVGLPPKVVANFATSDVSEEAIARITAENPEKTLACAILKALAKGARLQKVLEVGRLRASTLGRRDRPRSLPQAELRQRVTSGEDG